MTKDKTSLEACGLRVTNASVRMANCILAAYLGQQDGGVARMHAIQHAHQARVRVAVQGILCAHTHECRDAMRQLVALFPEDLQPSRALHAEDLAHRSHAELCLYRKCYVTPEDSCASKNAVFTCTLHPPKSK